MSEIETETTPEADPIEAIYTGECSSLSERSILTYAFGRHAEDGTLHLAITGNSGGGMWCKDWASASAIQDVVLGESGLTAKAFHCIHSGRSINTGGFILAALRDIGLIRVNSENSRLHEHVPTTTLESLVMACIQAAGESAQKTSRRKGGG